MTRLLSALAGSALALFLLAPQWALAGTFTVDQSNTPNNGFVLDSGIDAQTFTAGLSGPIDSVDLMLDAVSATVTVSIQGTTGSPPVPDGNILAQLVQGVHNSTADWVRFSFTAHPTMVSGRVYAIFIFPTDNAELFGSSGDTYPRGRALKFVSGAWQPAGPITYDALQDWDFKENVQAAPTAAPTLAAVATAAATPQATPTGTVATAASTATATVGAATPSVAATATGTASGSSSPSGSGSSGSSSGDTGGSFLLPAALAAVLALIVGGGLVMFRLRR
jgi:hypothetical protein